jgi:hypothetical protein
MVFRREGTYALVAVLGALVVAGLLFAGSAWSADKNGDSKQDRKESRQEKRTLKSETRTDNNTSTNNSTRTQQVGTQAEKTANNITLSKVGDSDPVQVDGLLLYTIEITNNENVGNRPVFIRNDLPNSVDLLAVDISGGSLDDGVCEWTTNEDEVFCEVTLGADNNNDTATLQIVVEPEQVQDIDNFAEVFGNQLGRSHGRYRRG